jgi:hypothetical protein
MDDGTDVFGIGSGSLSDSIDREQIARIYRLWIRATPGSASTGQPPQRW